MKAIFICTFCVATLQLSTLYAQPTILADSEKCSAFFYSGYDGMPPLNTSMPYNVMIGYIALDSLCKIATPQEIHDRAMAMTEDSLLIGYKYLYDVANYDPILFRQYSYAVEEDSLYKSKPIHVTGALNEAYRQYKQWDTCDATALWTNYIYHIRVLDITSHLLPYGGDTTTSLRRFCGRSLVLEKFKGQCTPDTSFSSDSPFEYITVSWAIAEPHDPSRIGDSLKYYEAGQGFLNPSQEYIVFLKATITSTEYGDGWFLKETYDSNLMGYWVMPVANDVVYDETNYFGFGQFVTMETFANYLRNIHTKL